MKKIRFYLDFDGTISKNDVVDMVLEKFAKKEWRDVEKEWLEGRIGSRECLTRQLKLVSATQQELAGLCREVEVDEHLISFLKCAKSLEVSVTVVSDGFDFIIQQVLGRALKEEQELLKILPVYSNKIQWTDKGPRAAFLSEDICRHGCANCKPEVIRDTAWADDTILFVGDGMSDRYAAELSNVAFAKSKLLKYCVENEIHHVPYTNFKDIENWLREHYEEMKAAYNKKATLF